MSNKLEKLPPPGFTTLPIRYPYPTQSGQPQSYTVTSFHVRHEHAVLKAHMGHGGAYNPILGWGLGCAHLDLLASETANLVKDWVAEESRIITLDGLSREQQLRQQVEATPIMQQIRALQESVHTQVDAIQQAIKERAEQIAAKMQAEEAPKNGHAKSVEISQN